MDEQPFAQIPENIEIKQISAGGGGNSLTAKNSTGKIELKINFNLIQIQNLTTNFPHPELFIFLTIHTGIKSNQINYN